MPGAASKLVQSIFWPISVWPSFTHVEEHPVDDYVEQTTPIIGTAIGFWACVAGLLVVWLLNLPVLNNVVVEGVSLRTSLNSQAGDTALQVLLWFLPVLYVAGFWMFANREDEYPN